MSAQQTIEKVNLRKKLKSARDMDKNIKLKILFRMHQKNNETID